jgi:hypothetical protein
VFQLPGHVHGCTDLQCIAWYVGCNVHPLISCHLTSNWCRELSKPREFEWADGDCYENMGPISPGTSELGLAGFYC